MSAENKIFGTYNTKQLKSHKVGADGNPRDILTLYFKPDVVSAMADKFKALTTSERGVKVTIHTGKKAVRDETGEPTGRMFDSSFVFIDEVQAAPYGGGNGGRGRSFVPKSNPNAGQAAAASTLNTEVK